MIVDFNYHGIINAIEAHNGSRKWTWLRKNIVEKFLLLCLFNFMGYCMNAQQAHIVSLNIPKIELGETGFKVDSIIDARENKYNIGIVQIGGLNTKRHAQFMQPFSRELTRFLTKSMVASEKDVPLRIAVTNIQISEKSKFAKEYAHVYLDLDFYGRDSSGLWLQIGQTSTQYESKGVDVTNDHPFNIAETLGLAIRDFIQTDWRSFLAGTPPPQFSTHDITRIKIKVYSDSVCTSGIFRNYDQFQNNQPSIKTNYETKTTKKGKVKLWAKDRSGYKVSGNEFNNYGFCHQGDLFIHFAGGYYLLYKSDNGFEFNAPAVADMGVVGPAFILAGVVGAAVASTANSCFTDIGLIYQAVKSFL